MSERLDIYGLGKTIQYLLAFVGIVPEFTKREEKRLQKMITKCISLKERKGFEELKDVQRYINELK